MMKTVDRPNAFRQKPPPQRTELDPAGPLRAGCLCAVLFEPGPWQRDYLNPGRKFTASGGATTYADGPFGGSVMAGAFGYLSVAPTVPTPGAWTVSCMTQLIGTIPISNALFTTDGAGDEHFYVQSSISGTPGALSVNGSNAPIGSWRSNQFTGWHRITVTASATMGTATFYFDGVVQGTGAIALSTNSVAAFLGDATVTTNTGLAISDLFVWNYALTQSQVSGHVANPYGSVLRPKFAKLARVKAGVSGAPTPSLMTTGVGP